MQKNILKTGNGDFLYIGYQQLLSNLKFQPFQIAIEKKKGVNTFPLTFKQTI
jgi:hypothetical protein